MCGESQKKFDIYKNQLERTDKFPHILISLPSTCSVYSWYGLSWLSTISYWFFAFSWSFQVSVYRIYAQDCQFIRFFLQSNLSYECQHFQAFTHLILNCLFFLFLHTSFFFEREMKMICHWNKTIPLFQYIY